MQEPEKYASRSENVQLVRVEPARGQVPPRSACVPLVLVPDVGARLGVQRAVLMSVLAIDRSPGSTRRFNGPF